MFQADLTKGQLSSVILNEQNNLNAESHQFQRRNRGDIIGSRSNVRKPSYQQRGDLSKNAAEIQLNQIELKNIDQANNLIKERMDEEQNLLKWGEKFPYGKENVDISEDVLERYRGNYHEQGKMLEKFREQAEQLRRTHKKKGKSSRWQGEEKREKVELRQVQRMRRLGEERANAERVRWEEKEEEEKEKMRKIGVMLRGLSHQVQDNSYILDRGLRELEKKMKKKNERNRFCGMRKQPEYRDIIDLVNSSSKIPIVVYRDREYDARLYFSDVYKSVNKVAAHNHQTCRGEGEIKQYKAIISILNENDRRLRYLDRYCKQESPLLQET